MARRSRFESRDSRDWSRDFADGGMEESQLDREIETSMRTYVDYQLLDQSLPMMDGMKPVHLKTLYYMWTHKARSGNPYVKSLAVASGTVAEFHPHSGDAVYKASAGLTRANGDDSRCNACKLNLSLIDGHGNFGASFEDAPAAPRYTEQRLSATGEACVRDVTLGASFMVPSFDARSSLPELLPTRLPMLLINGSSGLAYGYNVSWLPHNPSEAIRAVMLRLDRPDCTARDLLRVMPGPDFPTGGVLVDPSEGGIEEAYSTGFGRLTLTCRYEIRPLSRGRHAIDIYETPFGVNRGGERSIISGLRRFAEDNPEYGVTDVRNLLDGTHEVLIEVTVKAGIDPQAVADAIVRRSAKTMLTSTVGYRQSAVVGDFARSDMPDATGREGMLRLASPKPRDLSMLDYIDEFIRFRRACVINVCEFQADKARARMHLIDGMLRTLLDIDRAIQIIRRSRNRDTAKGNLRREFKLDDVQAEYVLGLQLARLTRSDKVELEGESRELAARVEHYEGILSSEASIDAEIRRQLEELLEGQVLPRRTTIVTESGEVVARAASDDASTVRAALRTVASVLGTEAPEAASAGGDDDDDGMASAPKGRKGGKATDRARAGGKGSLKATGNADLHLSADGRVWRGDAGGAASVLDVPGVPVDSTVLLVFEDGGSLRVPAFELATGPVSSGRRCVGVAVADGDGVLPPVAMATSSGRVKVLDPSTLTKAPECGAIGLPEGDTVLVAAPVGADSRFVLVTSDARLLTFPASDVNPQGRAAAGVAGVRLAAGARVVGAAIAGPDALVLTTTGRSSKVTPLSEFPTKGRGTSGVRCQRLLKGEDALAMAAAAAGLVPTARGKDVDVPVAGRDASGSVRRGVDGYRV